VTIITIPIILGNSHATNIFLFDLATYRPIGYKVIKKNCLISDYSSQINDRILTEKDRFFSVSIFYFKLGVIELYFVNHLILSILDKNW